MDSEWITYELQENPKEIAIFKRMKSGCWKCIVVGKEKMKGHWNLEDEYTLYKEGEFTSSDSKNINIKCICRDSTEEEIKLGKETIVVENL